MKTKNQKLRTLLLIRGSRKDVVSLLEQPVQSCKFCVLRHKTTYTISKICTRFTRINQGRPVYYAKSLLERFIYQTIKHRAGTAGTRT
jgi:hypothetical protein